MTTLDAKQRILDDAGFAYNFDRRVYYDRKRRKIFSVEFIEDNDEQTLEGKAREDTGENGWKYYFSREEPSDAMKREIEAALG